jgi:DNA-binding transcriptional LysR family regulator
MTNTKFPLHRYDLTDLRVFLAVADSNSVTHGAHKVHLAPSSVSTRLKSLEGAVGTPLFTRQARGVALTQAGSVMAEHVRRCLDQLEQMHADLTPFSMGLGGHITLFANNNAISSHLPKDLARFFTASPQVRITLEEQLSMDIVAAVAAGRSDIGVAAASTGHPDLLFTPYKEDQLVLLVPKGHALAGQKQARFSDCLTQPFISLQPGAALQTFLINHAQALGHTLDVRVQVSGYRAIARLVASGAGVGIVPRSALEPSDSAQVKVLTLLDSWAMRSLHVCVRRQSLDTKPFLNTFIRALCGTPAWAALGHKQVTV